MNLRLLHSSNKNGAQFFGHPVYKVHRVIIVSASRGSALVVFQSSLYVAEVEKVCQAAKQLGRNLVCLEGIIWEKNGMERTKRKKTMKGARTGREKDEKKQKRRKNKGWKGTG